MICFGKNSKNCPNSVIFSFFLPFLLFPHGFLATQKLESGFVGCLRDFRLRGKPVGKWSRNNKSGVVPCSDKVKDCSESDYFTHTFFGELA